MADVPARDPASTAGEALSGAEGSAARLACRAVERTYGPVVHHAPQASNRVAWAKAMPARETGAERRAEMKVNCLSCGHGVDLDDAYDDYEGPVKCFACRAILQVKTEQGQIKHVELTEGAPQAPPDEAPATRR
jgi:hypothetical protein